MPASNPFAPYVETGVSAGASVGGVTLGGGAGIADDAHVSAGIVLLGLGLLVLLWKSKFRFSTTVG